MNSNIYLIVFVFVLILFSAFFSAAETAYSSISKSKIRYNLKNKSATLVLKHLKSFGWTLSTILICNNLVNILASSLITFLLAKLLGASGEVTIISTIIMTPIIVVCGEIIPKILAKKYPYGYLSKVSYVIEFLNIILFPITYPLSKITLSSKITNSELELKNLIKIAKEEKVLDKNEAILTSKALDLDSTTVSQIMIKKQNIISVNWNDSVFQAMNIFKKSGHSRLPVIRKKEYIGIIFLKDIFLSNKNEKLINLLKEPNYVSKNILITKALENLRIYKSHMVFVSANQESKKTLGIITIEDIIEQLIGEIYDEHDYECNVRVISHNKWMVKGTTSLKDIENKIKIKLENNDNIKNIKQWIQSRINRTIKKDLIYIYKNELIFKIISNKNKEDTIIQITKK